MYIYISYYSALLHDTTDMQACFKYSKWKYKYLSTEYKHLGSKYEYT